MELLVRSAIGGQTEWLFAVSSASAPSWRLQDCDGMGLGVVATRAIRRGERIVREAPLLTCAEHVSYGGLDEHKLHCKVAALPPAARAQFESMVQGELKYGPLKSVVGIWRSNAYQTRDAATDGTGHKEAAVFANVCRINHSCVPNAHVAWSEVLEEQTVHAIKPIVAGEPITVCYMDPDSTRDERRAHLRTKLGFVCGCALCSLPECEALEASDANRRQLREVEVTMCAIASGTHGAHSRLVQLVRDKLRLLQAESLPMEWAHMDMVRCVSSSCAVADFEMARTWLLRAIQSARTILGDDSKVVRDLEAILAQRP